MSEEMMQAQPSPAKGVALIVRVCDQVIHWSIFALAVLMPIFVLPWTIEVSEINKQLLLLFGAAIAGLAWLGRMLAERKFEYRRSVVNVMVVLFVAVYAVSSWRSYSSYMSVIGDFGQEMSGLVTVLALATLYFVIANNLKTIKELHSLLRGVIIGGFIALVFALLQGFGLFLLPFDFAKSASFNTIGTATALGMYTVFIVTLAGGLILIGHNSSGSSGKWHKLYMVFLAVTGVLGLIYVAALRYWPVTLCLMVASAVLIAFAFVHAKNMKGIAGVLLPIAALVVSLLVLIFRFPIVLNYPAEVMPSWRASYDITVKTLREKPFFGSGPGTFIFDYAKYRSADVNGTVFWNLRFDRASSDLMTVLATTGLLGALSWFMMAIFLLISAARKLMKSDEETWHVLIGIFAAWLPLVVSSFIYSSNITLEFAFWITMGLLVAVHRREVFSVRFENSPRAAMAVSFIFILGVVFGLTGLFVESTRYAGEIAYARAIRTDRAGGNVDDVVSALNTAVSLNSSNDVYVRNLALAMLGKADKVLTTTPTVERKKDEKDGDYKARVDQAQKDAVQQATSLTADAVNTAKAATDINSKNVANWSVLGSVYESLLGVTQGADDWAVKAFQTASDLEPANPIFHTELGKVYLFQSDVARQAGSAAGADDKTKKDAEAKTNDLLDKAVEQLNKAIDLKTDYAPARYNLALAYDRQNKLKDAITKMEEVVVLNPTDVGVGFQLSLMYYRDNRKDDAIKLMESVVRLQPKFSNARWYLAAMYEEKGDIDSAIAQIQEVDKLNPGNDLVSKKLAELNTKKAAMPTVAPDQAGQLPPPVEQSTQNQNQPDVGNH